MSEIRANTVSNAAGTGPATLTGQSAAKAWVNFDGTGTIAARDSFNVSSLTDNGTGDYTTSWTSAMADTSYCYTTLANVLATSANYAYNADVDAVSVGSLGISTGFFGPNIADCEVVAVLINGDLA